jgi:hypothetical protein
MSSRFVDLDIVKDLPWLVLKPEAAGRSCLAAFAHAPDAEAYVSALKRSFGFDAKIVKAVPNKDDQDPK